MRDVADPMALFDFSSFVMVQYFFLLISSYSEFNREYIYIYIFKFYLRLDLFDINPNFYEFYYYHLNMIFLLTFRLSKRYVFYLR